MTEEEKARALLREIKLTAWLHLHNHEIILLCLQYSARKLAWEDARMAPVRRAANWKWN